MKAYWRCMSGLLVLSFMFFACQDDAVEPVLEKGQVAFEISSSQVPDNYNSPAGRTDQDIIVPIGECDLENAAYAKVIVDEVEYTLDIQQWGDNYKTNLLELDPGEHVLSSFIVFTGADMPLSATPTVGSEFEKFVDNPLPIMFEVLPYRKLENLIEVLCIEEFEPPLFGFKFWNIDLKSLKYLCIFVNYCEDDYGHMVAPLTIMIFPSIEETELDDLIWEGSVGGAGELLCAKFPWDPDVDPELQTYYVVLMINGTPYTATIGIDFIDMINDSPGGYLHLNENCDGTFEPFALPRDVN